MPWDSALELWDDTTTVEGNDGAATAITLDGGQDMIVEVFSRSDPTGSTKTMDIKIQGSFNTSNTTWVDLVTFPQLSDATNKGKAGTRIAKKFYLPRSTGNPGARGANAPVKLRAYFTNGGADDSWDLLIRATHASGMAYGHVGNTGLGAEGALDNVRNFAA